MFFCCLRVNKYYSWYFRSSKAQDQRSGMATELCMAASTATVRRRAWLTVVLRRGSSAGWRTQQEWSVERCWRGTVRATSSSALVESALTSTDCVTEHPSAVMEVTRMQQEGVAKLLKRGLSRRTNTGLTQGFLR